MFHSLRLRLTLWFIVLSAIVYSAAGVGGYFQFKTGLTGLVDEEIESLVSEILPAIEVTDKGPSLSRWASTSKTVPFKFLPTIQLFNRDKQLVEEHGPPGLPQLFKEDLREIDNDVHPVRIFSTPLQLNKKIQGYLQIQLSLRSIDRAANQFAQTLAVVAPFLLLSLGVAGYIFSGKATQPIEESFQVLRRFMNDAGHELSTPISIIQANAEAMELDLPPPESESNQTLANKLAIIERSTDRMGTLVQDLMLLSRMESPQVANRRSSIQLDNLAKQVLEEFDELFKSKGIELKLTVAQMVSLTADGDQLKRLMTNLLQNAYRYTDTGGSVHVTVDTFGRYARLVITDSGIGIPSESVPKIFDRFYRVDKSRSRAAGGVGLGLSIVRAIVESHKGKIDVTSEENKGTSFTILLPR
ncbi:MAG TPA: HAMP domain-containing sensor histidine kinase [Oculatellaceae cyanobacterium]